MNRVLFIDFDGTLVDSLPGLRATYFAFLQIFGIQGSLQEFEDLNGPPLPEIVRTLQTRYQLNRPHDELELTYQQVLSQLDNALELNPGGKELLDAAETAGYSIAIVSSSPATRIRQFLNNWNLSSKIHLIIGADDSSRSKPHPEPYLAAINMLSASPSASIAVEDSTAGAAAAIAADVPVLLLGEPVSLADLPFLAFINSLHEAIPFLTPHP